MRQPTRAIWLSFSCCLHVCTHIQRCMYVQMYGEINVCVRSMSAQKSRVSAQKSIPPKKRPIYPQKGPTSSQKSSVHLRKSVYDVCPRKRDLYVRRKMPPKRCLMRPRKKVLQLSFFCSLHVCVTHTHTQCKWWRYAYIRKEYISATEPMRPQQKSCVYPEKSPMYPQERALCICILQSYKRHELDDSFKCHNVTTCDTLTNSTMYVSAIKGPMYPPKGALCMRLLQYGMYVIQY